jgi:hypothetical protein
MRILIERNQNGEQDQDEFDRKYTELNFAFDEAKTHFDEVKKEKDEIIANKFEASMFLELLNGLEGVIQEFGDELFGDMVSNIKVLNRGSFRFRFKNNMKIETKFKNEREKI